jgi:hypothetical protein
MDRVSRRRLLVAAGGLSLLAAAPALGQSAATYPDTPEGLKRQVAAICEATRAGDGGKATALVRSLALPEHEA